MRVRIVGVRTLPPALSGILSVLRLLPKVSLSMTLLLAAGVTASTLLPLGFTIVAGLLVGSLPAAIHGGMNSVGGRHLLVLLAAAAGIIVVIRLLAPLQVALAESLGRRVDRYLQERVIAAVGRPVGIAHLEEPATLNLIESAQGVGTQRIHPGDGVAALGSLLPSWFGVVGSILILMTFRWWLGLAWLCIWPVLLYYLQREYIRVGQIARGQASVVRRANYYRDLALAPTGGKEVRLWGMTDWLIHRFETTWQKSMESTWRARRPSRMVLWLSTLIVIVGNITAFWLLASAAIHNEISLAALAIYSRVVLDASSFRASDDQNMHLAYAAIAVPSLLELEKRLETAPARPGSLLAPHNQLGEIRFNSLRFRYPEATTDSIEGLNLVLRAGESLAIVGMNGAGKTTLVKLLCKLYEPTDGAILVDGTDLRTVDAYLWRSRIAAIFQDFARYELTARDNVSMGAPALANDAQRLEEAARQAGALELITALPNGWDTILSRSYTNGVDLSGGEWQRIALARALFAVQGGARILILDEPTANLDVRAEADMYDRFLKLTAGLTTILISHRFSTVRRADRIVVLDRGKIAEEGTHDDLVSMNGSYAHMFRLQAERFANNEQSIPDTEG